MATNKAHAGRLEKASTLHRRPRAAKIVKNKHLPEQAVCSAISKPFSPILFHPTPKRPSTPLLLLSRSPISYSSFFPPGDPLWNWYLVHSMQLVSSCLTGGFLSVSPVAPSLLPDPCTVSPAAPSLPPDPCTVSPTAPSLPPDPCTVSPVVPSLLPDPCARVQSLERSSLPLKPLFISFSLMAFKDHIPMCR